MKRLTPVHSVISMISGVVIAIDSEIHNQNRRGNSIQTFHLRNARGLMLRRNLFRFVYFDRSPTISDENKHLKHARNFAFPRLSHTYFTITHVGSCTSSFSSTVQSDFTNDCDNYSSQCQLNSNDSARYQFSS